MKPDLSDPKHILINISETTLSALLPNSLNHLIENAQRHLRRIYPRGLRINSSNLDVLKFWRNGSHVVSLNWQHYDLSMQLNEAMFLGTKGWVTKPSKLIGNEATMRKQRIQAKIVGASSCQ